MDKSALQRGVVYGHWCQLVLKAEVAVKRMKKARSTQGSKWSLKMVAYQQRRLDQLLGNKPPAM